MKLIIIRGSKYLSATLIEEDGFIRWNGCFSKEASLAFILGYLQSETKLGPDGITEWDWNKLC